MGRAVGRHRHQYRATDARRSWWTGGRGTRPDQDPYGGGAKPGEGPRAAHGPAAETDATAASRGAPPPGRGRDAGGTGQELQRRCGDDLEIAVLSARL